MRKHSRQHGTMELRSYAPGDGGIAFTWVSENDPNGPTLDEPVTESDVSEWLEAPENKGKWDGWDIVMFFKGGRYWDVRLAHLVYRPFHTSNKLVMDGSTYEYHYHGPEQDKHGSMHHTSGNTDFYNVTEGRKLKVENVGTKLGLCFFLNNEASFEKSGHRVRGKR